MNRPIRRVGYAITVLILLLVAQLTYLQVVDANHLAHDPRNVRGALREYNRARGEILTADGGLVARSLPSTGDFKYLRVYPMGTLFAEVSGFQSFVGLVGNTGVEQSYDKVLTGQDSNLFSLGNLLSGKADTNNVVLSLTQSAQTAARDALGNEPGSVVALDIKTGAVLAMYSNPSYNPNGLSVHNSQFVQNVYNDITRKPDEPLKARAYTERYPPGSTFKVVTTKAALDTGLATPDTEFDSSNGFEIPGTSTTLQNFGGETCGGTLTQSLIDSCNATFAQLGYQLNTAFPPQMEQCGINRQPPIDLSPSRGHQRRAGRSPPTAPGSRSPASVRATCSRHRSQMALVAAGIANGGVIMQPHVVKEIQSADGAHVKTIEPQPWTTCMTPETAAKLTAMMVDVVDQGTGTAAQIDGVQVAGKTGTAQTTPGEAPHAWFIAFAPALQPRVRGSGDRRARRQPGERGHWRRDRRAHCQKGAPEPAVHQPIDCSDHAAGHPCFRQPIRARRRDRSGRHGRRLPRARPAPGSLGRGQGAAPRDRDRPGQHRALPARGAGRGIAEPPEHRRGVRLGRGGRHRLHRHGVRAGPDPARRDPHLRPPRPQRGRADRDRDRRRARRSRTATASCTAT